MLSASGGLCPLTPLRGLCPWISRGTQPADLPPSRSPWEPRQLPDQTPHDHTERLRSRCCTVILCGLALPPPCEQ